MLVIEQKNDRHTEVHMGQLMDMDAVSIVTKVDTLLESMVPNSRVDFIGKERAGRKDESTIFRSADGTYSKIEDHRRNPDMHCKYVSLNMSETYGNFLRNIIQDFTRVEEEDMDSARDSQEIALPVMTGN